METDRRRHPRVSYRAAAIVSMDGTEVGRFQVQDLSASGAFLTGPKLPVGARIAIQIASSPLAGARLEATVVRTQPLRDCEGIGVAFLPASNKMEELLQETIISEIKNATVAGFIASGA
jgi:hypothetical protein